MAKGPCKRHPLNEAFTLCDTLLLRVTDPNDLPKRLALQDSVPAVAICEAETTTCCRAVSRRWVDSRILFVRKPTSVHTLEVDGSKFLAQNRHI